MTLFVASVAFAILVSALCSLTEASLYSVRMPYARRLAASGSAAGKVLIEFKQNMERPITAILILNTTANTAGAAVAGAQADKLFGHVSIGGFSAVFYFSALFTLAILFFSEILPKVAGVTYGRTVARYVSLPLAALMRGLAPLVSLSRLVAKLFSRGSATPMAPEEEVHQLAMLSAEEGSIYPLEAELVQNVLRLDEISARDIMTPRTVVFKLDASRTVSEVAAEVSRRPHTRIPIHRPDDPEHWIGLVLKDDILTAMARDHFDIPLESLQKPLGFVPETLPGHRLLNEFLKRHTHMLAVIDEYGGMSGVVSFEDLMESLIGTEIIDETDTVADLQQAARRRGARRLGDAFPGAVVRDTGASETGEPRKDRPARDDDEPPARE